MAAQVKEKLAAMRGRSSPARRQLMASSEKHHDLWALLREGGFAAAAGKPKFCPIRV
jgi:hypothetical protein